MLQQNLDISEYSEGPFLTGAGSDARHFMLVSPDASAGYAAAACAEILNCANRFLNEDRFSWEVSEGLDVVRIRSLHDMARTGLVLIGGTERPWLPGDATLQQVRPRVQSARHLCVVGSGVFVPLAVGHLNDKTLCVHPNFRAAVLEMAPFARVRGQVITHSHRLSSAIGGMAAAAMILDLIGQQIGAFTAQAIAEYLGMCHPKQKNDSRMHWDLVRRSQGRPVITESLTVMQSNLESTLSTRQIARAIGVSPRHLERSFSSDLNSSPMRVYRELRLDRAHRLLVQTSLPILEVAAACGFNSTSNLSKWYRKAYGESPGESRKLASGGQ